MAAVDEEQSWDSEWSADRYARMVKIVRICKEQNEEMRSEGCIVDVNEKDQLSVTYPSGEKKWVLPNTVISKCLLPEAKKNSFSDFPAFRDYVKKHFLGVPQDVVKLVWKRVEFMKCPLAEGITRFYMHPSTTLMSDVPIHLNPELKNRREKTGWRKILKRQISKMMGYMVTLPEIDRVLNVLIKAFPIDDPNTKQCGLWKIRMDMLPEKFLDGKEESWNTLLEPDEMKQESMLQLSKFY